MARKSADLAPASNAGLRFSCREFPGLVNHAKVGDANEMDAQPFPALRRPATMSGVHRAWLPGWRNCKPVAGRETKRPSRRRKWPLCTV